MVTTLILSIIPMASLLFMIFAAVVLIQSKKLFATAPKDIQAAILPRNERFPGARLLGWCIALLALAAFVGAFVYGAYDGIKNNYGLWKFFERFLTMLYLEKAFDIIFLDWFLLLKTRFYQHFYPETAGCEGYRRFGFNRREQLLKIVLFPFLALLAAWICTLL